MNKGNNLLLNTLRFNPHARKGYLIGAKFELQIFVGLPRAMAPVVHPFPH